MRVKIVGVGVILLATVFTIVSYTIVDQQEQIEQLEQQLHEEQMKYKILINDPLVRDAMESGG